MPALEEIQREWTIDSVIDETKLVRNSADIPKLHSKYYTYLIKELYQLEVLNDEVKKVEHYLDLLYQPNRLTDDEYDELGWEPLNKIPPTAAERSRCVALDDRLVSKRLAYTRQKLKCDFIKEIVQQLNNRNWTIRNVIEAKKFENGGY